MKADPHRDHILLDGKRISAPEPLKHIIFYKPRNVISAVTSPDPRPTVRDLVPVPGRLYPVGRLDIESEGLILLTNDGELANRITHPRYGCEKEYRVLVAAKPDEKQLQAWRHGIVLEDGYRTAPAKVRIDSDSDRGTWLRVIMQEGRKRQIREVGSVIGLPVLRIIRTRIGSIHLGNLKPRQWRELTAGEVSTLRKSTDQQEKKRGKRFSKRKKRNQRSDRY
jgi:23S rRNA pseudouridine2605 synthase